MKRKEIMKENKAAKNVIKKLCINRKKNSKLYNSSLLERFDQTKLPLLLVSSNRFGLTATKNFYQCAE